MRERYQKWVVLGVGVFVVIGGAYWYMTSGKQISEQWNNLINSNAKQKEEVYKLQPSGNQGPIDKRVLDGELGVMYLLKVKLVEPWTRQDQGEYKLLLGGVVLEGDPLGRIIQIQIGMLDGTAYIGEYSDGWEGTGYYRSRSQSELAQKVELGDEMWLEYKLPPLTEKENRYTLMVTRTLDGLADEFRSGEFQLTIPEELMISTEKVGVISK